MPAGIRSGSMMDVEESSRPRQRLWASTNAIYEFSAFNTGAITVEFRRDGD
jgi:hypothetical protein